MDTQPTPTPEQPHVAPEQLRQPIMPDKVAAPAPAEAGPSPAAAPQNSGAPTTAMPHLTAQDVAAAIAAAPMPSAPVTSVTPPSQAADVDVVEPEWVEAAEQVMEQTAGNPYAEEEGFETLQVDYLKKRYGHEVKKPGDK